MCSRSHLASLLFAGVLVFGFLGLTVGAQTTSTGMIIITVLDPSSAPVADAALKLRQTETNFERTGRSDSAGRYSFALLTPGVYDLDLTAPGFAPLHETGITVLVAEKTVLEISLKVAGMQTSVTVKSEPTIVQTASSTLGRVIDEQQVVSLPLATRNYTQILALSPGVIANVANAGTLGRNSLEISNQGGRLSDNNVQVNGADANNPLTTNLSDGGGGQGVAVPAPDTIQEFKVQTALYDASTGRNGGANIDVITKSGTNGFHGNLYEFFRNEALNANDFFLNRAGVSRPRLRQNQFGFTLGGPVQKDKTFFFVSYEGNRQSNGVNSGSTSAVFLPPLTNDRSAATLGNQFGGQKGFFGGVAVKSDGSNINPVALSILNAKLPNGQFVIPTPQIILPSGTGQSNFSIPAPFTENQTNINLDHLFGSKDTVSEKYFFASTDDQIPFGAGSSVPGFPATDQGTNHNLTLTWTHIFNPSWLNQARFAFTRLQELTDSVQPISAKSVGITTPINVTGMPNMGFLTSNFNFGAALARSGSAINNFQYSDSVAYSHGRQTIAFGGEIKRTQSNVVFDFDQRALLRFFTFPDFLLGLPFPADGAPVPFGNIFVSSARAGLIDRAQRSTDYAGYVQDNIAVTKRFQVNVGVRYELYGTVSDALGRLANFIAADAIAEPPSSGTFTGFVVAHNTIGGTPPGVIRRSSNTVINNDHNNFGPRIGMAFRPFAGNSNFVIRSGYGAYFSKPGSVINFESAANLPFALISTKVGVPSNFASLQSPFDPTLPSPQAFPVYLPRFAASTIFVNSFNENLKAPIVHQWSLNMQYGFASTYLFELGYVGTRGVNLIGSLRAYQSLLASPAQPVHGITTNTVANAGLRSPIQGVDPNQSSLYTNGFDSHFNALEASLAKHFSHGLQFLASYTWSHNIDDLPLRDLQALGGFIGDITKISQGRASADTDRRHRFVLNSYWQLPKYANPQGLLAQLASGWAFSGIATFQSGLPFSVVDTSAATIYAATGSSRAQLAPGATPATIKLSGSVESRLNGYFNVKGFTKAPPIGNGTGFGNSPRNLLRGPNQRDIDLAIIKMTHVGYPTESSNLEFRAEFYNAFNFVNFGQPGNNSASPPTFGVINSTTVAPRIVQFALKFNF